MDNPLLFEIARLYDLIEQKENEYAALIDKGIGDTDLLYQKSHIDDLKKRLHTLAEMLLEDSL